MVSTQYLLEVSLCWLVSYGCYQLWLSQETFFRLNRFYLLVSLGLGLLLPLLSFSTLQTTANGYTAYHTLNEVVIGVDSTIQNANIDWLWYGYLAGVIFFLGRFIKDLASIYLLAKRANIAKKGNHYHVETAVSHPPFSFFQWLFLSQQPELDAKDKQYIIEHELAHIQYWHSLDILFIELLTILFWFNPLLHGYKKALREVHEYEADYAVTKNISTREYGYLLVRQTVPDCGLHITHNFNQSQLKKRIIMMTKKESSKNALMKYLLAAPLLVAMMFVFSSFDALPTTSGLFDFTVENVEPNLNTISMVDSVYREVDEMPRFAGCETEKDEKLREDCSMKKMLTYVYTNIKYPDVARKAGTEGVVVVRFIVDKTGQIINPKVVRDLGNGCGTEVLSMVNKMAATKWIPGIHEGKNVNVIFNLPVRFKLAGDSKEKKTNEVARNEENLVMPYFAGCEKIADAKERRKCSNQTLITFISNNLKYPKEAKDAKIAGLVLISFKVDKTGQVSEPITVKKGIGFGADKAALDVVEKLKTVQWSPGTKDGKPVGVMLTLPFKFAFDKE